MAKIKNLFVCAFILCSCHNRSVQNVGVSASQETKDSAINDLPITVDTTFADTAKVLPVVAIIEKEQVKTQTPTKKDTVVSVVTAVIKNPSLQEIYLGYIGVRELTGHNDGKEVERFLKNVGLGKGNPWCAAFVKTCLLESGNKIASRINGMALSCENKNHFIYRARQSIEDPLPGDVFTIYYSSEGRIGHTGFVNTKVNSDIYETVEGNTNTNGSPDGVGVFKRKRSKHTLWSISRWDR